MSLATSYMCFGCTEIAWNQRTRAYVDWACSTDQFPGQIPQLRWMCDCEEDDPDTPFTNPIDDEACWYDPLIPESAQFLGVVITKVGGLRNSTFTREVEDGISGGSLLSQPVIRGKELVFEGIILATTCAGMDYGLEWLRRQLEDDARCPRSGTTCASCQGQLLTMRVHCPGEDDIDRGLRSFASAGTIDGVDLVEDDYPMGSRECCTMRSITFTLQTENATSFSTLAVSDCSVEAADDEVFQELGDCGSAEDEFPCCPICSTTCDPCTTDPGCDCFPPYVLVPEVVGADAGCSGCNVCRCIRAIGLTDIPSGYEAALRFTFSAGWDPANDPFQKYGLRNTIVRIYQNPEEFPLPVDHDTYTDFVDRYLPCAEFGVSWMPAGSQLIVDGLTGKSWLLCNGKCVDHSSRVFAISGSVFPLVARCTPLVATIEWDCLTVQTNDVAPAFASNVRMESFLRHRL